LLAKEKEKEKEKEEKRKEEAGGGKEEGGGMSGVGPRAAGGKEGKDGIGVEIEVEEGVVVTVHVLRESQTLLDVKDFFMRGLRYRKHRTKESCLMET
jgi:hypothetical protein